MSSLFEESSFCNNWTSQRTDDFVLLLHATLLALCLCYIHVFWLCFSDACGLIDPGQRKAISVEALPECK